MSTFQHGEATGGAGVQPLAQHLRVALVMKQVRAGRDVGPVPTVVNILAKINSQIDHYKIMMVTTFYQ